MRPRHLVRSWAARGCTAVFAAVALAAAMQVAVAGAQASAAGHPVVRNPYSPAYRHPYRGGVIPTRPQLPKMRAWARRHPGVASPNDLSYGGGIDGIGVTTGTEKVYLVFYGSQWGTGSTNAGGDVTLSGDPAGAAPYLQELFKGLGTGGELWSGVMTQYCDGVAIGAQSCPASNTEHVAYPTGGALAGVWVDESAASPAQATPAQLGSEAVSAAAHFGNTTAAANRDAQYVIISPAGTHPDGFNTPSGGFCAWHDWNGNPFVGVTSPYGDIAFTNLPYVTDLGASCGENFVNAGQRRPRRRLLHREWARVRRDHHRPEPGRRLDRLVRRGDGRQVRLDHARHERRLVRPHAAHWHLRHADHLGQRRRQAAPAPARPATPSSPRHWRHREQRDRAAPGRRTTPPGVLRRGTRPRKCLPVYDATAVPSGEHRERQPLLARRGTDVVLTRHPPTRRTRHQREPGAHRPDRPRLLPAPLADPAHLARRGGLPDHAVDLVRRTGQRQLHRQRSRADPAQPAFPPAVRGHADAGDSIGRADHLPGRPGPGDAALAPFARAPHVTSVSSPYRAPGQISADGHIAFATVQFGVPSAKISNSEALALMSDARAASGHGVRFSLGGDVVNLAETPYGGPTEGIGTLAAAIVLLIAFGSFLAMGLPIATALLGIGGGLSVIALLGHIVPAPSFSPIVAAMIGLGVGVDYALFIVTRSGKRCGAGRPRKMRQCWRCAPPGAPC